MTAPEIQTDASAPRGVFELQSAHLRLGSHWALAGVTLNIALGECVALVGANGSGKTSLLRVLHGLLPLSAGHLQCDPLARQAMVFQKPRVFRASVLHNVALGAWLQGQPWGEACDAARHALAQVGLAEMAQLAARNLSGGQQQRLALARALVLQPSVLLLDEPSSHLDAQGRLDLEAHIARWQRDHAGATMVFASHDLAQVQRLASRVIGLEQGRIALDVPVADLRHSDWLAKRWPQAHLAR